MWHQFAVICKSILQVFSLSVLSLSKRVRCFHILLNANYGSNNGVYKKRDKVRIKRIVLDLHDVIADSKKVVVFEYEMPLLS